MANGKKISKKDATDYVKKYKNKHTNSTNSVLYDATIVQQLLAIPGCVSLRIHFAENNSGINCLVLVAVDASGNAILPPNDTTTTDTAFIVDDGSTCPPTCPSGVL